MNPPRTPEAPITVGLIIALAIQNAVPPFATDMYSPAFPQVAADLGTSATAVGLTLTAFFIGMGTGQLVGGTASDRYGRRHPIITGGLICTLGGIVCALAPGIGILLAGRILQGFGGGIASVVGRAVLVDIAHGDRLARIMSILMAVGGLAPMLAPVTGSTVLSVATWRMIFWCLAGFGLLMMAMAAIVIPETLPASDRRRGGLRRFAAGFAELARHKRFMGYMLTSAFSGFAMFAYISASSFVLQEIKGLTAMQYSVFFGCTAGANMLMALTNSRLVGRYRPRRLIAVGLGISGGRDRAGDPGRARLERGARAAVRGLRAHHGGAGPHLRQCQRARPRRGAARGRGGQRPHGRRAGDRHGNLRAAGQLRGRGQRRAHGRRHAHRHHRRLGRLPPRGSCALAAPSARGVRGCAGRKWRGLRIARLNRGD